MKICLVMAREEREFFATPEPYPDHRGLCHFLRQAGHEVTILLADLDDPTSAMRIGALREQAETVHSLARLKVADPGSFHPGILRLSWFTYVWLKTQSFDAVIFQDYSSAGLIPIQAKKLRDAFAGTAMVYQLHGPAQWSAHLRDRRRLVRADMTLPYSVKYGVENCDFLIIPAEYLRQRIGAAGWRLPRNSAVLPYLIANDAVTSRPSAEEQRRRVIYPIHHSDHSALSIFLQALNALEVESAGFEVSFLCYGSPREQREFAKHIRAQCRDRNVQAPCEFIDAEQAPLPWGEGTLWLFSPFWLNLPCLLLEAAERGEAMLVARSAESESVPALTGNLVEWDIGYLASHVGRRLKDLKKSRPQHDTSLIRKEKWHAFFAALQNAAGGETVVAPRPVRVTVCVAHFNKGEFLPDALASLHAQTHPNLEVIVVDDASTDLQAREVFRAEARRYASPGWLFITADKNGGPGRARNLAAQRATGSHLLFFDADDVAFPDMVERMVRGVLQPGVDCVAASCRRLMLVKGRWQVSTGTSSYVGGSLETAFLHPPAGTVFIILKETFDRVGGFKEDVPRDCHEDWHIHVKMLAWEYRLHVLSEPVFAYRATPQSRSQLVTRDMLNNLEPFLDATPQVRQALLRFAIDRAGACDNNAKTLAEFDYLAPGIRLLRSLDRMRKSMARRLPWGRREE